MIKPCAVVIPRLPNAILEMNLRYRLPNHPIDHPPVTTTNMVLPEPAVFTREDAERYQRQRDLEEALRATMETRSYRDLPDRVEHVVPPRPTTPDSPVPGDVLAIVRGEAEFIDAPDTNVDSTIMEPKPASPPVAFAAFGGVVSSGNTDVDGAAGVGDASGGMNLPALMESAVQFAREVRQVGPRHLDCANDRMPPCLGAPSPNEYPRDLWPPFILYLWVKRGSVEGLAEVIVDLHLRYSMSGKKFSDNEDGSQVYTRRDQRIPWKGHGAPFSWARHVPILVSSREGARPKTLYCGRVQAFEWELILGRDSVRTLGLRLTREGDGFPTEVVYDGIRMFPQPLTLRHHKVPWQGGHRPAKRTR
ncbi:hypothetical protein ACFE04_008644 [Oxalis oulophora]